MTTVAVLGAGVAGLTAAHELGERGFDVALYERRLVAGGKARSLGFPKSGTQGRPDLPAEHGFRFFPGFYRHVPDSMARIPLGSGNVSDHFVETTRTLMAQAGGRNAIIAPTHLIPRSLGDLVAGLKSFFTFATKLGLPPGDLAWFIDRLLVILSSCDERRFAQLENESWWEFTDAAHKSVAFQKFLADGLTRTLVAAKAREMSARTGGTILLQLLLDMALPGKADDRVLDGPTSDVWIEPWISQLRSLGVKFFMNHEVKGFRLHGNQIDGVAASTPGGPTKTVRADFYVAALPVEVMDSLVTPAMRAVDPVLAGLHELHLHQRWMNGIMFYLGQDVPLVHGHAIYIDSPWALTSISQQQFWPCTLLDTMGNGRAHGVLSVDVSDWEKPGLLCQKPAKECTADQIHEEVWAQLEHHLDVDGQGPLQYQNVDSWFLDEDILIPNPRGAAVNLEPLLINTAGSWYKRPNAATRIPNLVLASDYVRTYTDLATMEGANEAARRAVNAILEGVGSPEKKCEVWPLQEPAVFKPLKWLDSVRFRLGLP